MHGLWVENEIDDRELPEDVEVMECLGCEICGSCFELESEAPTRLLIATADRREVH